MTLHKTRSLLLRNPNPHQERAQAAEAGQEAASRQQLQASFSVEALTLELAGLKSNCQLLQQQLEKKVAEIRCAGGGSGKGGGREGSHDRRLVTHLVGAGS